MMLGMRKRKTKADLALGHKKILESIRYVIDDPDENRKRHRREDDDDNMEI